MIFSKHGSLRGRARSPPLKHRKNLKTCLEWIISQSLKIPTLHWILCYLLLSIIIYIRENPKNGFTIQGQRILKKTAKKSAVWLNRKGNYGNNGRKINHKARKITKVMIFFFPSYTFVAFAVRILSFSTLSEWVCVALLHYTLSYTLFFRWRPPHGASRAGVYASCIFIERGTRRRWVVTALLWRWRPGAIAKKSGWAKHAPPRPTTGRARFLPLWAVEGRLCDRNDRREWREQSPPICISRGGSPAAWSGRPPLGAA